MADGRLNSGFDFFGARSDMKITKVEAIYVRLPEVKRQTDSGQDALLVRIDTDEGVVGVGEVDSAPLAVKGMIEGPYCHEITSGLREILLGEDPFCIERLWQKMYTRNIYAGRRGLAIHAMSGIDLALWDIKGKALDLPIWRLLGGGFHERIRAYASSLFGATPTATRELAIRYREAGFTAVKFGWEPMGRDAATDVDLVRQARAGLGAETDLMIDAGLAWDTKTAIRRARAFEEFDLLWLEEPLAPDNYAGYRRLSEATDIPIAAGEEESEHRSYLDLMDQGAIDIVQIDLTRCGGFSEALKVASLARDRGLRCVNHGFTTYLNVAAALHFLASIPNSFIAEYPAQEGDPLRDELTSPIPLRDGFLEVPQGPGLGIEVDWEAVQRYRVA